MKYQNQANVIVRESITEALLILMSEKDFHKISISELTEKAGVGRVSFYRNYNSKEDILFEYMSNLSEDWWNQFQKESNPNIPLWLFKLFEELKHVILLLYKSNVSYLFYDYLKHCCGPLPEHSNFEAYSRSLIVSSFFGWCDEWIKRGMQESPEEMVNMITAHEQFQIK